MPSTPPHVPITPNAIRCAQIGTIVLRRRITGSKVEDPTHVRPFPVLSHESAKDITIRLRFLLARQGRGETHWGTRLLVDAIADCRAELELAQDRERHG